MAVAEQTLVGAVINRWIQRQRVTVAHVAKHGRLARSVVYYVMDGTTKNPEVATLKKIARGLASDPYGGPFDTAVYAESLRDLTNAVGEPFPDDEIVEVRFEDQIARRTGNKQRAPRIAEALDKYPTLSPDLQRLFDAAVDAATSREDKDT